MMEEIQMRELFIGQRIKKFRKKKDLTQEEMAGHLNISFQTIYGLQ